MVQQPFGIYTLANDVVYDQLVALLNSIEANIGSDIPVCVIPFDQRLSKVKQEVESRDNVTLFANDHSIQRWEAFAQEVWAVHPAAQEKVKTRPPWGKGHHRKFVTFDGLFDKFVFYDADTLVMKPIDDVFEKLKVYDFVFNDWEHKKPLNSTALDIKVIEETGLYKEADIRPKLHCSSFFGSKLGIFNEDELSDLKKKLIEQAEIKWVPRWWDDAFLFTYMTLRCDRPLFNFTLSSNSQDRTGNCADSDPFVNIDNILYNQEGLKPIHRLHYMNYPSINFTRLSQGEAVDIRYQDEFLYYRFLKEPEKRPQQLKSPNLFTKANRKFKEIAKKVKSNIS